LYESARKEIIPPSTTYKGSDCDTVVTYPIV